MSYRITLTIEGEEDFSFFVTDEDFEFHYQDSLVKACEEANIDTMAVINATSEPIPDEDKEDEEE